MRIPRSNCMRLLQQRVYASCRNNPLARADSRRRYLLDLLTIATNSRCRGNTRSNYSSNIIYRRRRIGVDLRCRHGLLLLRLLRRQRCCVSHLNPQLKSREKYVVVIFRLVSFSPRLRRLQGLQPAESLKERRHVGLVELSRDEHLHRPE